MLNFSIQLVYAAIFAGTLGMLFILLIDPENIDLCVVILSCQIALFVVALIIKLVM